MKRTVRARRRVHSVSPAGGVRLGDGDAVGVRGCHDVMRRSARSGTAKAAVYASSPCSASAPQQGVSV